MKFGKVSLLILLFAYALFADTTSSLEYEGVFKPLYNPGSTSSFLNKHYSTVLDTVGDIEGAKDSLSVDFEGRQITYTHIDTATGVVYHSYHYNEMTRYFDDMYRQSIYDLWKSGLKEKGRAGRERKRDSTKVVFQAPVHLPRWAKRIVGDEPPKLSITGTQKIKLGFRFNESGTKGGSNNQKLRDPIFQPSTEFAIKGTIGRLLELEIRLKGNKTEGGSGYFDKDDLQSQLDEIKVHYHSDSAGELEDDIIQEVIIGKTNFSMPGLGLIGYPAGGDGGLFGVKVVSKIGPLDLTTIASIEQVENEEKEFNLNAGSRPDTISEKRYEKNRFFFVDTIARELYIRKSSPEEQQKYLASIELSGKPTVEKISIFKRLRDVKDIKAGMYYVLSGESTVPEVYQELDGQQDYFFNSKHNYIRMANRVSDDEELLYWVKFSNGKNIGNLHETPSKADEKEVMALDSLAFLKRRNQSFSDPDYALMMRNVYVIKKGDGSDFTFNIVRKNTDGTTSESNDKNEKFIDILQLTKDGLIDKLNADIFDHENGFLFIPPFIPSGADSREKGAYPFTMSALGTNNTEENVNGAIYIDSINSGDITGKFQIATSSSDKMTSFSLGFGIKDGTEKIWHGSDTLQKNVDYTISYFSGTVDLISSKAKSYNSVKATYQKESLFLLDKKVLLGINGMLKFPNIGRNSYLSTTLMWQLMNAKSITPKIGTEPYNRFAIGANLQFDFEPEWMTRAVNKLPGIETEAKSQARFSLEVAHSKVETSAKGGNKAYIDNFSTSEQNFRLEASHARWYRASLDYEDLRDPNDTGLLDSTQFFKNIPAWESYWYKPLQENQKTDLYTIYPKPTDTINTNYNADEKISTLKFVANPFPKNDKLMDNIGTAIGDNVVRPWAGIVRGLNGNLRKRTDDRYFEFWIDLETEQGELFVDFGEISEDLTLDGATPNNIEDYEKFSGAPSVAEDIGFDKKPDSLEYWCFPNFSMVDTTPVWRWDTLRYGTHSAELAPFADDPARDNWARYDSEESNDKNKRLTNGTEKSNPRYNPSYVEGESEDFNKDGRFINIRSSRYFRYKIPLDYDRLISDEFGFKRANDTTSKWVKVRLPISALAKEFDSTYLDTVNNPNWDNILQVRFLWKDMTNGTYNNTDSLSLEFADMQFVGNQWVEFLDLAGKDSLEQVDVYKGAGKVTATVLNTKKDGKDHLPTTMEYDKIGKEEQPNYTLVLDFDGVKKDDANEEYIYVAVERKFDNAYSTLNFSPYEKITFMLSDTAEQLFESPNDSVWFTFRIGASDSSYYEYRTRIAEDAQSLSFNRNFSWDTTVIELKEFTQLKLDWFNVHGERYGRIDTTKILSKNSDNEVTELIKIYSSNQTMPSLTDVKWLSFGILSSSSEEFNGQVMLNNFQALDLRSYKGTAMKAGVDLKWADLMDNNFGFKYKDANFRSMSDEVHKQSHSEMDGSISSDIYLNRFMPSKWGINIPVGGSVNATLSRPEIRPNSDIYLRDEQNRADGFSDMSKDFINLLTSDSTLKSEITESEKYQNEKNSYHFYTSYKKTKESKNPVVNLTADRVEFSYDYTEEENRDRQGLIPEDEISKVGSSSPFHEKTVDKKSQSFKLSYDISPNRNVQNKLKLKPFKKLENRKMRKIEFSLLPSKVRFGLLDIGYNHLVEDNSIDKVTKTDYKKKIEEKLGVDHSFEFQYKPIDPLIELSGNLDIKRNFERRLFTDDGKAIDILTSNIMYKQDDTWRDFNIFNDEENRSRKLNFKMTPNVNNWLTMSFKLNTSYDQDIDLASNEKVMKNDIGNDLNISTTLQTKRLFDRLAEFQKKRDDKKEKSAKVETVPDDKSDDKKSDGKKSDGKKSDEKDKKKDDVLFKRMANGLNKINFEQIKFSYDANMDVKNSFLEADYFQEHWGTDLNYFDYLKYSTGLYGRGLGDILRGTMNDDGFAGIRNRNNDWGEGFQKNVDDSRKTTQRFTISSSFDIPKPLDLRFNTLSLKWNRDYKVTPDYNKFDTTITWPDIKVGVKSSILEKVGDIKKHFRNLSLSSAYNFNLKTNHTSDYWNDIDTAKMAISSANMKYTTGYGFKPLMKLDGTLKKKKIDVSYSMDLYFDTTHTDKILFETTDRGVYEKTKHFEDAEMGVEKNHKWTFAYKKKGKTGKKIKIFRNREINVVGDVEYRGEMGLLVENTRKYESDLNHQQEEGDTFRDRSFTLEPSVKYTLTKKITCDLYYRMKRKYNDEGQTIDNSDEVAGEITIKF